MCATCDPGALRGKASESLESMDQLQAHASDDSSDEYGAQYDESDGAPPPEGPSQLDEPPPEGPSPLLAAVRDRNIERVRALLEEGHRPKPAECLLSEACRCRRLTDKDTHPAEYGPPGNLAIALLLLPYFADVDLFNRLLKKYVVTHPHLRDLIPRLLERGADVNHLDSSGWSLLYYASKAGNTEAVATLLDHGARVNQLTKLGHTPLYPACWHREYATASLLLWRGADHAVALRRFERERPQHYGGERHAVAIAFLQTQPRVIDRARIMACRELQRDPNSRLHRLAHHVIAPVFAYL